MSRVQKVLVLEITPEQFLNSCSPIELQEVQVLILSPYYQKQMEAPEGPVYPIINPPIHIEHEDSED